MVIPEGSLVKWSIKTEDTDFLNFILGDSLYQLKPSGQQVSFSKKATHNIGYAFVPSNQFIKNGDTVLYSLQVIPDKFPTINVTEKRDSTNNNRLYFRGEIGDDYGFTALSFNYKITTKIDSLPNRNGSQKKAVSFNKSTTIDEFFHFWNLEGLNILPGDEISYYFEVWDNDGVNGRKSAKTSLKMFKSKSIDERNAQTSKSNKDIKKNFSESISEAKQIQKDLEELKKKLAEKKEIGWEEKQKLKDLLEKQKELEKKVNEIRNENQQNNKQQNEYKKYSEEVLQKQDQLQKLFDELMTDEMKEMMQKLQEMMEKMDKNMLENELDNMEMTNEDLEKELDRSLELFKQMEFEQKLDEVKNKLDELAEKQEQLSEDTKDKKETNEQLNKKQEELNKELKKKRVKCEFIAQMD